MKHYSISSDKPLNHQLACNLYNCACRITNFIWVSERLKLVYFETPKCGCTSIKKALDIGQGFTPLHFAMAYVIGSQRYCAKQSESFDINSPFFNGDYTTTDGLYEALLLAASNLCEENYLSDPVGKFEFMHFFGSPQQALDLFPRYRKFVVLRDPFDRLVSAWNMFYNASRYREHRRMQRVIQCRNSNKESCSFKFFLNNFREFPDHHFESLGRFIPAKFVLSGEVEAVLLENLDLFWKSIAAAGGPFLGRENRALSYLAVDALKSDALEEERFLSYYADDFMMIKHLKDGLTISPS